MKAFTDIKWTVYFWNMAIAVVKGIGATGVAWCGTAAGHAVTESIPVLQWDGLLAVLIFSIVANLFLYLQTNGLPAMVEKAKDQT